MWSDRQAAASVGAVAEWLGSVVAAVRAALLRSWSADNCIATCRVTRAVLAELGVRTGPLPVSVTVYNRGGRPRATGCADPGLPPVGPWATRVRGSGRVSDHTGGWDGHLTLRTSGLITGYLIDPSLDQYSAPEHDAVVGPAVLPLPPGGWLDQEVLWWEVGERGAVVTYRRLFDAGPWQTCAAWSGEHRRIAAAVRCARAAADDALTRSAGDRAATVRPRRDGVRAFL